MHIPGGRLGIEVDDTFAVRITEPCTTNGIAVTASADCWSEGSHPESSRGGPEWWGDVQGLRDRLASIKPQLHVLKRTQDENAELASSVFELSQTPRQPWLTADYAEKRKTLKIVWLQC